MNDAQLFALIAALWEVGLYLSSCLAFEVRPGFDPPIELAELAAGEAAGLVAALECSDEPAPSLDVGPLEVVRELKAGFQDRRAAQSWQEAERFARLRKHDAWTLQVQAVREARAAYRGEPLPPPPPPPDDVKVLDVWQPIDWGCVWCKANLWSAPPGGLRRCAKCRTADERNHCDDPPTPSRTLEDSSP